MPRLRPNPLNKTQNKRLAIYKSLSDMITVKAALLEVDTNKLSKSAGISRKTFYNRKKHPEKWTIEQLLIIGDMLKFRDEDYINIILGKEII